ncbi:polysaccharide deacetylase [Cohnella endophytica]|uniref:Polysaccharide deacetylase n=1 Tax=Cohnella endophytica TaxID=2419778 RepID=A0A494XL27_9BACL|nr:polysaccharide deacetylase family protein [Cohnella endophytica]RKP48764.1 polysaccharide deacetylase [Cohnella endophytica]
MRAMGKSRFGGKWLLAVACAAAVFALGAGGQTYAASSTNNTKETAEAATNGKTVYLTFDDGPSALTGQVLDILRKAKIKATFFVVGNQVESRPKLLERIAKEGHSIGNHSYDHVYKELYGDFKAFAEQVVKTEGIIERTAGVKTRLLRAPGGTFGNFDSAYFDALKAAGYIVVDWNVDSGDSKRRSVPASEIIENVTNSRLTSKMIVLMHDGSGHGQTVKALPAIIQYFAKKGYTFAPLTDQVKPVTFRIAPQIKWKRINPTLADAVSWLGGQGAALANVSPQPEDRVAEPKLEAAAKAVVPEESPPSSERPSPEPTPVSSP